MALQSLTTTPTPSGTETTAPTPGPNDTNANSGLLGPNGPQPLVPAFILSALLIVGIVTMCWWRRLAARRAISRAEAGMGRDAGIGMNYTIGAGRGLSTGLILLAARGAEIHMEQREVRRKKEVKLGPKPVLWDIYLEEEGLADEKDARWHWREMRPVSASYLPAQPQSEFLSHTDSSNPIASPSSPDMSRTHRKWIRRVDPPSMSADTKAKLPERQRPPMSRLRISVFVSMPTPREGGYSGHTPARKPAESSASSEIHKEEAQSLGGREESLGDCNLVLGITEVPFDHSREL